MPKIGSCWKFGSFRGFLRQTACACLLAMAPNLAAELAYAQSLKYRAFEAWRNRTVTLESVPGAHDSLAEYSAKCDAATGIKVPNFSCSAGVEPPGQGTIPETQPSSTRCNFPNVLNNACDPGSKFQVLPGRTADAVAVAHCRKNGQQIAGNLYNDIAVIQYNKKNGALCFYQALIDLPGEHIPAPKDGDNALWEDLQLHWISPEGTEAIGCTGCHDNGGFIRSEYLAHLTTLPHALPNASKGFDNLNTPVRYVGLDYATRRSWSIKTANAPEDGGQPCTTCHRLAVPSRMAFERINGTAAHFANEATAKDQCVDNDQCSKNPHGPTSGSTSPIWMRLGQVLYHAGAEASATKYRDCAVGFFNSNFTAAPEGCHITPLGEPWKDIAPADSPFIPPVFPAADTITTVNGDGVIVQ